MPSIEWMPLESNPDVMNRFLENLGVPKDWAISDVFSLDEDMLTMIPTPCVAFLLLFPVGAAHVEHCIEKEKSNLADGVDISSKKVYFLKQTIRNACGTIALIHAVANNVDQLKLANDSLLGKFIELTKDMNPEDRGRILETFGGISIAHECSAQEGQTEAPGADADVNLHFIAFVNVDNELFELDGRQDVPVCHGKTSESTFIKDAAKICQEFMLRDPENVNFTILSLGPAQCPL